MSNRRPGLRPHTGPVGFCVRHPLVDLIGGIVTTLICYRLWKHHNIDALDGPSRRAVYQTVTAFATALFGLTMTSVSILMSNAGRPLPAFSRGLPNGTVVSIAKPMFALLRALGLLVCYAFALLITDQGTKPWHLVHTILLALVAVMALRLARVTYLLAELIKALHPVNSPEQ